MSEINKQEALEKAIEFEGNEIAKLAKECDFSILETVENEFLHCKGKIILSGCGTSGEAAKKISHTLNCVKCGAVFLSPSEALHGGLGIISDDDIVVLLSKGGRTIELEEMIPAIKESKSKLVVVSEADNTKLAKSADYLIKLPKVIEADDYNVLATSSTMFIISIFDAIAIQIGRDKKFSLNSFVTIHPEGAVGKKISENMGKK